MNNFDKIKDDIIDFSKTLTDFEKVFIVRNIYSRFAIYLIGNSDYNKINFPQDLNTRIDTIQFID
jgi:hypothetical protein